MSMKSRPRRSVIGALGALLVLSTGATAEPVKSQPLKSAKTCNEELASARSALVDAGLTVREFIHACWNAHEGSATRVGNLSIALNTPKGAAGTPAPATVAIAPQTASVPQTPIVPQTKAPVVAAVVVPKPAAPSVVPVQTSVVPTAPVRTDPVPNPKPPHVDMAAAAPPIPKLEPSPESALPAATEPRPSGPIPRLQARRKSGPPVALIVKPARNRLAQRTIGRSAARLFRDSPHTRLVATVPRGLPRPRDAVVVSRPGPTRPVSMAGMKICWMNGTLCQTSNVESTARSFAPGTYQIVPASQKPNGL